VRFVKVDLDQEECETIHTLCEAFTTLMGELGHNLTAAQKSLLAAKMNSVRYKMGVAGTLFGSRPNLITPNLLLLDLAKSRKQ
jgi:gamma-glutamyl phosphate reductase